MDEALRLLEAWMVEANKRSSTYGQFEVRDRLLEIYALLTPDSEPVAA